MTLYQAGTLLVAFAGVAIKAVQIWFAMRRRSRPHRK